MTGWIDSVLKRASFIKRKKQAEALGLTIPDEITEEEFSRELKRVTGSTLPDNPTMNDFRIELVRITQLAKIEQNENPRWSPERFRKLVIISEKEEEKIKRNGGIG